MFRLLLTLLFFCSVAPAAGFDHAHIAWHEALRQYALRDGRVNYGALKKDLKQKADHPFLKYLKSVTSVGKSEFDGFNREQQIAFLINAYNALTWKLVIDHYPVKSIKDIGGFFGSPWKEEFFVLLDGEMKTLDSLEHTKLRGVYKEPRVHAALNCASVSCPRLQLKPFTATELSSMLDGAMSEWIADPNRNYFEPKTLTATISKIFDWYESDFVPFGGVAATLVKFGAPAAKSVASSKHAKIKYFPYDWALNDTASKSL